MGLCLAKLSAKLGSGDRRVGTKNRQENLPVRRARACEDYGEMLTPTPTAGALPVMARVPALTPTVRAKVSRMRFT
jgi:hypothetical protein